MNKYEISAFIGLLAVLSITVFFSPFSFSKQPDEENNAGADSNHSNHNQKDKDVYWGVDSASYTDESLYQCVHDNFGQPEVWGRYLGDKEGVSAGLDTDEVNYLQENDIRILVIYNHFTEATGYDHGVEEAKQAIANAEDLEIPEDVAIFGDIEPDYPVDADFMEGWIETLADSVYEAGIYGVFDEESSLISAYNNTNDQTQESLVLWTAYPQKEITSKEAAPEYEPEGPGDSLLYGWQYAIDAEKCNVDTNLFQEEMLDYLW